MIIPLRLTHRIDPVTGQADYWRPWRVTVQYRVINPMARIAGWVALDMTRGRWITAWMRGAFEETGILGQSPGGMSSVFGWTRTMCESCDRTRRQAIIPTVWENIGRCASCGHDNALPGPIASRGLRRLVSR